MKKILLFTAIISFLYVYFFTGILGFRKSKIEKHFCALYHAKDVIAHRYTQEGKKSTLAFEGLHINFISSPSLNDIAFNNIVDNEKFNQNCKQLAEEILDYLKQDDQIDFDILSIQFSTNTGFMHPNGPSSRTFEYTVPQ